jgi:hypothetical protein
VKFDIVFWGKILVSNWLFKKLIIFLKMELLIPKFGKTTSPSFTPSSNGKLIA